MWSMWAWVRTTALSVSGRIGGNSRLRWSLWRLLLAVLAAIPPLATWPLERWYRRRGWLSPAAGP